MAKILHEVAAKELLEAAGIPVVPTFLAENKEEAVERSKALGFPVVLKIVSPEVTHKTEAGGVMLNLKDPREVAQGYEEICARFRKNFPAATLLGVSVQKMVTGGRELFAGISRDPQFGALVAFGVGGIFVEVFKDVALRLVPLTPEDAWEMLAEIKGSVLLEGFRGMPPVNKAAIVEALLKLSALAIANPEISELDINPLFATAEGVIAADARVVLA